MYVGILITGDTPNVHFKRYLYIKKDTQNGLFC